MPPQATVRQRDANLSRPAYAKGIDEVRMSWVWGRSSTEAGGGGGQGQGWTG